MHKHHLENQEEAWCTPKIQMMSPFDLLQTQQSLRQIAASHEFALFVLEERRTKKIDWDEASWLMTKFGQVHNAVPSQGRGFCGQDLEGASPWLGTCMVTRMFHMCVALGAAHDARTHWVAEKPPSTRSRQDAESSQRELVPPFSLRSKTDRKGFAAVFVGGGCLGRPRFARPSKVLHLPGCFVGRANRLSKSLTKCTCCCPCNAAADFAAAKPRPKQSELVVCWTQHDVG